MNKKNITNIIYIFLLLQPIIDLFTSLMTRFVNLPITIGVVTRGLFLLFMVIYNVFFQKNKHYKKVIYYLCSLFIFFIIYFILKPDIFSFSYLKTEIIYLFKYFYFPILLVCLVNSYKELSLSKEKIFKIFVINAIEMAFLIIIPYLTGTSFSSYSEISQGAVGWFYSANEVGAIMVLLFPFMYYLLFERISFVKSFILFIIVITSMILLGTKTSFLGILIAEVLYFIYFLFNNKKNRGISFVFSLIVIFLSFVLIPNIPAIKNLQTSISNSDAVIEDTNEENESDEYYNGNRELERVFKVALSGRDEFFFRTLNIYKKSSLEDKIFGLGFVNRSSINNKKIEKLIEIDPLDIFFHYGIMGFILYFLPMLFIVFKTIKLIFNKKFHISFFKLTEIYVVIIILMVSMTAGHVYGAPPVSIYVIFAFAMFNNALDKNKYNNLNNNDKEKVTIFALHLGYGGVEKYISSLCKMLEGKFDVEIISTYKVLDKPAFYFSDNIKITYLIDDKPNKEEFTSAVKNKDIISIFKEGVKSIKLLYLKRVRNITAIRNTYSDYIITTRDFHNKLVGYYAYHSIVKIATEHNYHNNDNKYIRRIINSIKGFDYFIVVSNTLKEFYDSKIGKTKCVFIPNVIDDLPINKSNLNKKNIITIGRLSPEKGQKDLIDVFKIVSYKISNIKLFIVGDGPLRSELEEYTKKLNLQDKVIFTGFLNKLEMEKYILDSSLFVLPSYTESFGLVLIEAMSYSLPCIAFDSSDGARELLKDNIGILIENRNINLMADAIINKLNDNNLKVIGNNGYNHCKKYLIYNVKKSWLDVLHK